MKYIVLTIGLLVVGYFVFHKEQPSMEPKRLTNEDINNFFNGESSTVGEETINLYATSWCGYCAKARKLFNDNNIRYVEYDVEKDPVAAKRYRQLNGRGVPLIEANETIIRGYSEQGLRKLIADKRYQL